jgi:hypothetical protein
VDSASELVKLYADKFDLLRTGGTAPKKPSGNSASAATVKALEELKTVINGHLKVRLRHPPLSLVFDFCSPSCWSSLLLWPSFLVWT